MATGVMFIVMFGLMFLGVPIAVAMFISMFVLINIDPVTTSSFIAQTTYGGVASFTNLALPFFMISGTIMETGGLSKRLVSAANSIIGGVTGSLGMVTVIACMFFRTGHSGGHRRHHDTYDGAGRVQQVLCNGSGMLCWRSGSHCASQLSAGSVRCNL